MGCQDERILVAIDRRGKAFFYDILAAPKIDRSLPLLNEIQLFQSGEECAVIDCQNSPTDGINSFNLDLMLVTFSNGEIVTVSPTELQGKLEGEYAGALWL